MSWNNPEHLRGPIPNPKSRFLTDNHSLGCKTLFLLFQIGVASFGYEPMNMLGVIQVSLSLSLSLSLSNSLSLTMCYMQSQKTAEVLLDVKVNSVVSSPRIASADTANAIVEVCEEDSSRP